jgi:glucan phosphoethanolaminetransferase (alkaline phosphatase superfamily)
VVLRRLALDVAAWYAAPAVFLAIYIGHELAPLTSLAPHLRIVAVPLVALWTVRLVIAASLGSRAARIVGAALATALLALLLAYYILVLVGLHAWGRVVSLELILAYGKQLSKFADALGIGLPSASAAVAVALTVAFAGAWAYLRRFDWVGGAASALRTRFIAMLAIASVVACGLELYRFLAGPLTEEYEPVSLTLNPLLAARDVNGHAVDRLAAARRDAEQDAARRAYQPAPGVHRRNVILIVVDALRADHMSIYGYARDTTPQLQLLMRQGKLRLAPAMRAACASSMCGLLAIATSQFVHQFSDRPITLQEVLRRHGYRVHMLLAGDHTLFYGLRQAYGEVDSYFDARAAGQLSYMNDDRLVLQRLAAFAEWDGNPVMMQFHLMSAHALGARDPKTVRYTPARNYALGVHDALDDVEAKASAVNFYDNGVLQADAMIGAILDILARKGYLREALVAITADHGEALGEHGFFQHANSVREEVLRVPLVLLAYGYRPTGRIDGGRLASQVDIAPTLLAELGLPLPQTWQGRALQQAATAPFVEFQERWEIGLFDLRDPHKLWKYWFDMRSGAEYAFDIAADARERVNAIDRVPSSLASEWRAHVLARASVGGKRRPGQDPD